MLGTGVGSLSSWDTLGPPGDLKGPGNFSTTGPGKLITPGTYLSSPNTLQLSPPLRTPSQCLSGSTRSDRQARPVPPWGSRKASCSNSAPWLACLYCGPGPQPPRPKSNRGSVSGGDSQASGKREEE